MEAVNLRDPSSIPCRIYVGHLNENITQELLDIKFSPYGHIVGFLRTSPGFAFVQYDQPNSAMNAIQAENGSFLAGQRILVKSAEIKSQKKAPSSDFQEAPAEDEPMYKKYFSEANEYYGNNSIMAPISQDSDTNHCEIIVVSKDLTMYAEEIERQLKLLGIRVDLLFPNDQVPINKVLGNIQSRGCLYAILILPINLKEQSLTLTILYGDAAEHRNMPLEDAIKFIYKDFCNKTKRITHNVYQHPDAMQSLLKTLADNRSLTVLQYDHIIKYLAQRREVQRKAEIGEDAEEVEFLDTNASGYKQTKAPTASLASMSMGPPAAANPKDDLQKKILEILNKKPVVQQKVEAKPKPMTSSEKELLKLKLLGDPKIKMAMGALRNSKKLSK